MSIHPLDADTRKNGRPFPTPHLGGALVRIAILTWAFQICTAAVMIVLTHALTQEEYGAYVTAVTLQSYLFLIGSFGIRPIVVREVIRHPLRTDQLLTAYLAFTAVSSSVLALATALVTFAADVVPDRSALFVLIAMANVAQCLTIAPLFDAHRRQSLSAAMAAFLEFAWSASVLGLAAAGRLSLPVLGATVLAKGALVMLVHGVVYHYLIHPIRLSLVADDMRLLLRSGGWLMLSDLLTTVPLSFGVLLLWMWGNEREAAVFGIASQMGMAFVVLVMMANRIFLPHIAHSYALDRPGMKRVIVISVVFLAAAWCVAVSATGVLVGWVLPSDYHRALLPTAIILVAAALQGLGAVVGSYLVAWAKERYLMASSAIATFTFVAGSLILGNRYNALIAAGMTLIAYAIGASAMAVFALRCRRAQPKDALGKSIDNQIR